MIKSRIFFITSLPRIKKEWVEKLNNLSDPYIKQARDKQKEVNERKD